MTKKINRWVYLSLLCITPEFVFAQNDLRPIIVSKSEGTLSHKTSNALLALTSDGASRGILHTIARSSYGTDQKLFPMAMPYRGQVEMLADAVKRVDLALQERFRNFDQRSPGKRTLRHQFFWTESDAGTQAVNQGISQMVFETLTQYIPGTLAQNPNMVFGIGLGTSAMNTRAATESPELMNELRKEVFTRFPDIYAMRGTNPIWPLYFLIELNMDGEIGVDITVRVLFATSDMKVGKIDAGDALVEKFIYQPSRQGLGVLEFNFERKYLFQSSKYAPALAQIRFGRVKTSTMRSDSCKGEDCLLWINALPTMYMEVNPAKASWYQRTKAWLASFDRFKVMLRSVTLNLTDFSFDAKDSEILFVVDTYGGSSKVIDMQNSLAKNWFEYFAQRQGAIEGNILPAFDEAARKSLDELMKFNLDSLIFDVHK